MDIEKSKVSVKLAIGATIFICGLVLWAGRVEWVASATAIELKALAGEVGEDRKAAEKTNRRVLVIACKMKIPDPDCPRH